MSAITAQSQLKRLNVGCNGLWRKGVECPRLIVNCNSFTAAGTAELSQYRLEQLDRLHIGWNDSISILAGMTQSAV